MDKQKPKIEAFTTIEMIFVLFLIGILMNITANKIPRINNISSECTLIESIILKRQMDCILNNQEYEIEIEDNSFDGILLGSNISGEEIIINEKGNVNKAQTISLQTDEKKYDIVIWLGPGRFICNEE